MLIDLGQNFLALGFCLLIGVLQYKILNFYWKIKLLKIVLIPIIGLALIAVITTVFWFFNIFLGHIYYIFIFLLLISVIILIRDYKNLKRLFIRPNNLVIVSTLAILISMQGAFLPFSAKLFQGYPWDRFVYVGAAIGFTQNKLGFYERADKQLAYDGSNKSYWFDHLNASMATNEMHNRPTVDLLFGLFNFNTVNNLYRLGNSFETFLRIMQFLSFYYFCSQFIKNKKIAAIIAGSIALGFWGQFIKDFNAWGYQFATIMVITSIGIIVENLKKRNLNLFNNFCLGLLTLATCIAYPEEGFVSSLCLTISLGLVYVFFKDKRDYAFDDAKIIVIAVLLSFIIHPYNLYYLKLMLSRIGDADYYSCERYVRGLLNPYTWNIEERVNFIQNGVYENSIDLLSLPFSIIFGIIGFYYINILGNIPLAIIFTVILYLLFKNNDIKISFKKPYISFTIFLIFVWISLIIFYLLVGKTYPGLRSIPYIGPIVALTFICAIFSTKNKILTGIGWIFISMNIAFGIIVFGYQIKDKYHNFDNSGYGHTSDSIRLGDTFNYEGKIRDYYDLDFSSIIKDLETCKSVHIDLKNYWHMASLVMYLENQKIPYKISMPYKTLFYGGGVLGPGYNPAIFEGDCIVVEDFINGKSGYKLNKLDDKK